MDQPRMSVAACEAAERLQDAWARAWADGRIDPAEGRDIEELAAACVRATSDVDTAIACAVVLLRRGPESRRARTLRAELRQAA